MSIDKGVMPVITLYQPWATWVVVGWKTIETRLHRGFKSLEGKRVLIHGGKKVDEGAWDAAAPWITKEQEEYRGSYPTGAIIGSALVTEFRVLDENDSRYALIDCCTVIRYGLLLNEVLCFFEPMLVEGSMGIWYFDMDTKRKVRKSIK